MLSISIIKDAGAASSYYEKDDYYTGRDDSHNGNGRWHGKAAKFLGLQGSVEKEQLKELMSGNLPDGTTLGRWRNGNRQHTPGWDMTFSAPKSVSLMYEIAGDKRVLEAHQKAVNKAVDWIEDNASSVHKKSFFGRKMEETGNLASALFDHETNRNQDPQLHTHAVMLNVTKAENGKLRSMYSKPFFQQKMAGGNVYRSELASELRKIGYGIDKTHKDGRFEISGIEKSTLEAFSTRRVAIEEEMEKKGVKGAKEAEKAALKTRVRKTSIERSELYKSWQDRAQKIGFDAKSYINKDSVWTPPTTDTQREALNSSVERLSEQEAVFTNARLVGQILADGMGKITVSDAERLIREETGKGKLHASQLGDQRAWTTKSADNHERSIHQVIEAGKGCVKSLYSKGRINQELKDTTLNDGQKDAIKLMLNSRDQFLGIIGRPGTGKTFLLNKARELYEGQGYKMVGMASNAEAAGQISESAGVESKTLARHLIESGKELHRRNTELTQEQRLTAKEEMNQVWIVDEASQVNTRDLSRLTKMARTLGARIVLIGDPQQLGSIEAGKPFSRLLGTGLQHTELDDIRRQSKSEHISAIRSMISGDVSSAIKTLKNKTHEIPDEDSRLESIVNRWTNLKDRSSAMVITSRQSTKNELNDKMREVMRNEGKLHNEISTDQLVPIFSSRADLKLASTYEAGNVVRFNQDAKSINIKNGEYWNVIGKDDKSNAVQLEKNGNLITWDPRKIGINLKGSAQLFKARESSVSKGEEIIWSRNNSELNLRNGQRLTVIKRENEKMHVASENGTQVTLDLVRPDHRHWEHGYASTVYKSQGKTGQDVLVHAPTEDKNLLSQKAFLVAISRQKENITILTDNIEKLESNIRENLGDKTSAIEGKADRYWFDMAGKLMESAQKWMDSRKENSAYTMDQNQSIKQEDIPNPTPEDYGISLEDLQNSTPEDYGIEDNHNNKWNEILDYGIEDNKEQKTQDYEMDIGR